jgi:hypothetical protein
MAGDSKISKLLQRINHADPEMRMPPTDAGVELQPTEIEILQQWIQEGATWEKHWSFLPPVPPALPSVLAPQWPKNPIDLFILARLEGKGMQPSPRASKETLIRRATFDLTGLPPTLEEIDAYLIDGSPQAFERVVDRLLDSEPYGERMAMQWLDVARYADSHGYSLDRRRVMWPWRDWVIQAYNQNMPFDQFAIQQLAGDLLPNATIGQQVATGFNRNHPIQSEGGVVNEEYRVETVVDRVETTSTAFLGLTMGCCRCHDHKYDPISQVEFYQFYSFFNNVPETAHVGNADRLFDKPVLKAASVLQNVDLQQLRKEVAVWRAKAAAEVGANAALPLVERILIDDMVPAGAEPFGNGDGPPEFLFVSAPDHPVWRGQKASRRSSSAMGQHGFQNLKPAIPVTAQTKLFAYVYLDPKDPPQQIMMQWNAGDWEHRAYWGESQIPWGQDGTASRLHLGALPKPGEWTRLEVDAAAVGLVADAALQGWAFTQFGGTVYWDFAGLLDKPQTPTQQRLNALVVELAQLESEHPTTMIMGEMNPPRKTFVLARGQYDQPTPTEVLPAVPQAFGKFEVANETPGNETPGNSRANRLDLAKWLVSPDNPLTARVTVNRYWQMYFGRGIVDTPEDFGAQGARPTHPELLDWLATEFLRTNWDVKGMQKLIVMSATYQQSSALPRSVGPGADSENRWLARGPRIRLPAEMIRDHALAASGLLVRKLGGPSVLPYQPAGSWDDVVYSNVPRFTQDHGDKLYRRSMYTYWKRSVPPPNLQVLDAPSRETCVLQRSRTNTPQAALVLMNDPTFVEAGRKLAERVMLKSSDTDERIRLLFRLTTGRIPTASERSEIQKTLQLMLDDFRHDTDAAAALLKVGESPSAVELDGGKSGGEKLNAAELAAYATIANVLIGLDESITKH